MANRFTIPHNYEEAGPLFAEQYAGQRPISPPAPLKISTYNIDFGQRVDKAIEELSPARERHPFITGDVCAGC